MENRYLINQVSRISGETLRALRHYDRIGLLKPKRILENKYRVYTDEDLSKLQQIMIYKELDFDLTTISAIINDPQFNIDKALKLQLKEITLKINHLVKVQELINKQILYIKKGKIMKNEEKFKVLSSKIINEHEKKYAQEVKEKYHDSDAYKQSQKRFAKYSDAEKLAIFKRGNLIFQAIADNMQLPPSDEKIQQLVKEWQQHISENFYECTVEILKELGEIYIADQRFKDNIDKTKAGLAEYLSEAIRIYVKEKGDQ